MSSKRPKSLSPDDLNRPSVTLVAVVERAEDIQPERWTAALQREGPNFAELIILDRRDASTGLPSRWPSIHRPGPFTGPAFEAAAAHARARAIALLGRDAHRAPGHLRAAVKVLDLHAGIDLVISDYSLRNPQPGIQQVIQLSKLPRSPPPGWTEGAVFRTDSIQDLSPLACFPVLLHHYRALRERGQVIHLPVHGYDYPSGLFYQRLEASKARGEWLDRWETGSPDQAPEISVLLVVRGPAQSILPALSSLCAQSLPPHAIQVVLVAEGSEGSLDGIIQAHFPIRIDRVRRRAHGWAKALNKALTQAVAPLVAFCSPEHRVGPDWAALHIAAHRAHKGSGTVVLGPVLEPAADTLLARVLNQRATAQLRDPLEGLKIGNMSMPTRRLQAVGGWAPAIASSTMEMDLALRLARHGFSFIAEPKAAAYARRFTSIEDLNRRERLRGRAQVELCGRDPEAVDRLNLSGVMVQGLIDASRDFEAQGEGWLEAAQSLAKIEPKQPRPTPPEELEESLHQSLLRLVGGLAAGWRHLGRVDGLRAHNVPDFGALLYRAPLYLPGASLPPWFLLPSADDDARWIAVLQALIQAPERRPVVLWAHPNTELSTPQLANIAGAIRRRASLRSSESAAEIYILEPQPPLGRMLRLLHGSHGWIKFNVPAEAPLEGLARRAGVPARSSAEFERDGAAPWPVATDSSLRVLAWPAWESASELEELVRNYAGLLLGRQDCCLCLRLDPALDPPEADAVAALQQAYDAILGRGQIDILLITERFKRREWKRLGQAMDGVIWLQSTLDEHRGELLNLLECPSIRSPHALQSLLQMSMDLSGADGDCRLLILEAQPPTIGDHP